MTTLQRTIDVAGIGSAIEQLQAHFGKADVDPLIVVLEAIKRNPQDCALIDQLSKVFDGLDIMQGAVLTYAPYLVVILADSSFDELDLSAQSDRF